MSKLNIQQSPYKAISQSYLNTPQLTQISNLQTQSNLSNTLSHQKYKPITHQNTKCPIPIGSKSKDKISCIRKTINTTDQYFQKQLEIRTLQSKKLLEELQETQNNMNRIEKENWLIKNQYQSEKRKVAKYQRQNGKLSEEIKGLEEKVLKIRQNVCDKQNLDQKYLQNLKNLRKQLNQKEETIKKLQNENAELQKKLSERINNLSERTQPRISKSVDNSKFSTSIDLDYTARFLNKILPPPNTFTQSSSNNLTNCKLFEQSQSKIDYPRSQNFQMSSRLEQYSKPKYQTIQTCNNLQQLSTSYKGKYNSFNNTDYLRLNSHIFNSNTYNTYEPLHSNPSSYQNFYQNHSRRYPSARSSQRNQKRFSYDYGAINDAPLMDITRKYRNNERLTSRKFRKDKVNQSIIQRTKMILDF